jgi:hypothetical protein
MQGCLGLVGIIVIGALIANSGVGTKIMDGLNQLEGECYSAIGEVGHGVASAVCPVVGGGVRVIDSAATSVGNAVRNMKDSAVQSITGNASGSEMLQAYIEQLSGSAASMAGLESLMSSSSQMIDKIRQGPQGALSGASVSEQVRSALDSFSIGQQYLGDGAAGQALPWLQQGAATPGGYGLLSQMTLGNMYSQGAGGIAANPQAAVQYYSQSLQSLTQLQRSGSPQAQQILRSLPVSPQQIQQELVAAIGQLKGR